MPANAARIPSGTTYRVNQRRRVLGAEAAAVGWRATASWLRSMVGFVASSTELGWLVVLLMVLAYSIK
jgi:hypothetical protein